MKSFKVTKRENAQLKINDYDLEAGTYIYALIANGRYIDSKKMILTK